MARRLSDVTIVNKNLTTHFDSYDFTSGKSTPDVTSSGRLPVGFVIFKFHMPVTQTGLSPDPFCPSRAYSYYK